MNEKPPVNNNSEGNKKRKIDGSIDTSPERAEDLLSGLSDEDKNSPNIVAAVYNLEDGDYSESDILKISTFLENKRKFDQGKEVENKTIEIDQEDAQESIEQEPEKESDSLRSEKTHETRGVGRSTKARKMGGSYSVDRDGKFSEKDSEGNEIWSVGPAKSKGGASPNNETESFVPSGTKEELSESTEEIAIDAEDTQENIDQKSDQIIKNQTKEDERKTIRFGNEEMSAEEVDAYVSKVNNPSNVRGSQYNSVNPEDVETNKQMQDDLDALFAEDRNNNPEEFVINVFGEITRGVDEKLKARGEAELLHLVKNLGGYDSLGREDSENILKAVALAMDSKIFLHESLGSLGGDVNKEQKRARDKAEKINQNPENSPNSSEEENGSEGSFDAEGTVSDLFQKFVEGKSADEEEKAKKELDFLVNLDGGYEKIDSEGALKLMEKLSVAFLSGEFLHEIDQKSESANKEKNNKKKEKIQEKKRLKPFNKADIIKKYKEGDYKVIKRILASRFSGPELDSEDGRFESWYQSEVSDIENDFKKKMGDYLSDREKEDDFSGEFISVHSFEREKKNIRADAIDKAFDEGVLKIEKYKEIYLAAQKEGDVKKRNKYYKLYKKQKEDYYKVRFIPIPSINSKWAGNIYQKSFIKRAAFVDGAHAWVEQLYRPESTLGYKVQGALKSGISGASKLLYLPEIIASGLLLATAGTLNLILNKLSKVGWGAWKKESFGQIFKKFNPKGLLK